MYDLKWDFEMSRRPEVLQIAVATGVLAIGVLVYLLDRPSGSVYFIPGWITSADNLNPVFGHIGNHLPTFVHVYVLILLTAVVAVPSIAKLIPVCLSWVTLDCLFEIAQLNQIAQWIGSHTPTWFSGIPFLDNTGNYFLSGTFDVLDILSIAMGAFAAYLTVVMSTRRT